MKAREESCLEMLAMDFAQFGGGAPDNHLETWAKISLLAIWILATVERFSSIQNPK